MPRYSNQCCLPKAAAAALGGAIALPNAITAALYLQARIDTEHGAEMIPPHVDGCNPPAGSVLDQNVVRLFGNGFQYISGAPRVYRLPARREVAIDWAFRFDVRHPPEGQTGGSAPSEMRIWIERVEPGASYRVEYADFSADFTAGNDIRHVSPEKAAARSGWLARLMRRFGRFGT